MSDLTGCLGKETGHKPMYTSGRHDGGGGGGGTITRSFVCEVEVGKRSAYKTVWQKKVSHGHLLYKQKQ